MGHFHWEVFVVIGMATPTKKEHATIKHKNNDGETNGWGVRIESSFGKVLEIQGQCLGAVFRCVAANPHQ